MYKVYQLTEPEKTMTVHSTGFESAAKHFATHRLWRKPEGKFFISVENDRRLEIFEVTKRLEVVVTALKKTV